MKVFIIKLLLLAATFNCAAQGNLVKINNFKSKIVKERNIEIWLPPGYSENKAESYPVLYMHDGQNVFNPETSTHNIAWEADAAAEKLINDEKAPPFIIVGIWSTDLRYYEYFPDKAAQYLSPQDKEQMEDLRQQMNMKKSDFLGDEYLKFITSELKPYIDKNYRTLKGPEHTSIAGSSMGGLISMYAICEYPNVFGQAACVSTHWPILSDNGNMNPSDAVRKYMEEKLPNPESHRIYFDYGTATLDQYYEVHQQMVDGLMRNKGYAAEENWVTYKFEGAEHNEKSWKERMDVILQFLYPTKSE